jgi:DNA-binding NarL/FixJ family response regulator
MIRVLLVDDHPLMRDGICMRLHATQHIRVVGQAGTAREAERLTQDLTPDLVITDIRMPEVNGIHLAEILQERFPTVKVLVLSMHQDIEYLRLALKFGVRGYVLKDGPGQQLIAAIDAVHAGQRFFGDGLIAPELSDESSMETTRAWGRLTPMERAVLSELAGGRSSREIAAHLGSSVRTVETHRLHLRRKLRIESHAALVKYAIAYADSNLQVMPALTSADPALQVSG